MDEKETSVSVSGFQSGEKDPSSLNHFEDIATLREAHKDAIARIRSLLVNGEEPDDVIVYRFLRGYRFHEDNAAAALDKTLLYRKEYNTAAIRAKAEPTDQSAFPYADRLEKCYPHNIFHGFDRSGQPLSIELIGRTSPSLLCRILTLEQLMEYHLYHMENKAALAKKLSEETGKVVRMCKVIDMSGLGSQHLSRTGLTYLKACIKISQDNYPEMLGTLYLVNIPWIFRSLWSIIKPWLQPATLEKIQILGSDYKEILAREIDADNLPDWLGGTCSKCTEGCVVERDVAAGMVEVNVPARGAHIEEIPVHAGDTVAWEFRTQSKDIAFQVEFQDSKDDSLTVVQEMEKVASNCNLITGKFCAVHAGKAILTWDNSFSRWTSKNLMFAVSSHQSLEELETEQESHSLSSQKKKEQEEQEAQKKEEAS